MAINDKKYLEARALLIEQFPHVSVSIKDDCVLLEGELAVYEDIIAAGYMAVVPGSEGVINKIYWKNHHEPAMRTPALVDDKYDKLICDVLIIGGGIIGCAIARELSRYAMNTVLVEKETDVALHASSRNDGVIHIGIDLKVKTKKHQFLRQAVSQYPQLCQELKIPYVHTGQLIVFPKKWMRSLMFIFRDMVHRRGIKGMEIWNRDTLLRHEPHLGEEAAFGAFFPEGATISPYETVIALAENAIENGVRILLETAVNSMETKDGIITSVHTNRGTIYPRIVINAAGTFSDKVAALANDQFFTIHPRKGIEVILDKKAALRSGVSSISMYRGRGERKRDHTKGGGVIPTVDGNVLIGPTAFETNERENFETDAASVKALFAKHQHTLPHLYEKDVITYFAGIRAPTYEEDFIVRRGKWTHNIIHAAGIQSPGLTAAPAIAQEVARLVAEVENGPLPLNANFNPARQVKTPQRHQQDQARDDLIKSNPDYGQIVCRCEEISKGEIIDALRRPLLVPTLDGVKRRVRAGMGRCQGGFCGPLVTKIIHDECGIPYDKIIKKGRGTIIMRATKDATYGDV